MKRILLLAVCLWHCLAYSQKKIPLTKDAIIPASDILYINGQPSSLFQLRGQKIIIDLFSSSCIVCFQMLPKMNLLQEKYKHDLQFLLIGKEDGRIAATYERFRKKFNLTLAVAFDSVLSNQLKIIVAPTYVWLDENGKTVAVTGPEDLTEKNIEAFISDLPVVITQNLSTIFSSSNEMDENVMDDAAYYSLIRKYQKGMPVSFPLLLHIDSASSSFRVSNVSLADLYNYAYFGRSFWMPGDSLYGSVYPVPTGLRNDQLTYSYEYHTDKSNNDASLQEALQLTLSQYFGYRAVVTQRLMPYYGLIITSAKDYHLRTKNAVKKELSGYAGYDFKNISIQHFIQYIDRYKGGVHPIIDETGINYRIDISGQAIMTDASEVLNSLRHSGLDLVIKQKLMTVIELHSK